MPEKISVFSGFTINDLWFLGEASLRTLWISALSIITGTILGCVFGWLFSEARPIVKHMLAPVLDVFRSVPLIVQLVLFHNFAPIVGLDLNPFGSGIVILTLYATALFANIALDGIRAVGEAVRRAGRSLGMSYWQNMRHVVLPIGGRAVFPGWVGVALGIIKDSALVSVLGYVELLKASQILITRTQEPFLILIIAGAFYFTLSFPISRYASKLEQRWAQ